MGNEKKKLTEEQIDTILEHPIKMLIKTEPDLAESFASVIRVRERNFSLNLDMRPDTIEKINFTQKEIEAIRNKIEGDLLYKYYNQLNQHPEKIADIIRNNWENQNHISFELFGDKQEQGSIAIESLLNHVLSRNKNFNKTEIKEILKTLKEKGIESIALTNALQSEYINYEHRMFYFQFYFHYEKEYLSFLFKILDELKKTESIVNDNIGDKKESKKEFTTGRQVLAIHYLMDELNVLGKTDKTEIARFIQFLTGRETGVAKIQDTTIYQKVKTPFPANDKQLEKDLRFIRNYFEKLGLQNIAEKISKEIGSKE
jgi:hypothetical protein